MGMTDDDDTVYCDVQMSLAQGRELLQLVSALRESKPHLTLEEFSSACKTSSAHRLISSKIHRPGALGVDAPLSTSTTLHPD